VAQVAQVAQAASEAPDPAVDLTKKKKRAVVAKGTGTLVIMTSPAEALVVIDGKKLRAPTPTRALLPAGTHKIVVRLPPFREQSFAIDVVAGETVRKLVNLQ
jgi:hypothetical protein